MQQAEQFPLSSLQHTLRKSYCGIRVMLYREWPIFIKNQNIGHISNKML